MLATRRSRLGGEQMRHLACGVDARRAAWERPEVGTRLSTEQRQRGRAWIYSLKSRTPTMDLRRVAPARTVACLARLCEQ